MFTVAIHSLQPKSTPNIGIVGILKTYHDSMRYSFIFIGYWHDIMSSRPELRHRISLAKKPPELKHQSPWITHNGPGLPRRVPWRVLWRERRTYKCQLAPLRILDSPILSDPNLNPFHVWSENYVSQTKKCIYKSNLESWTERNQRNNEQT